MIFICFSPGRFIILKGSLIGVSTPYGKRLKKEREISAGDSINTLSLLNVWGYSIETVEAQEDVEAYGILTPEFLDLFDFKSLMLKNMQNAEVRPIFMCD